MNQQTARLYRKYNKEMGGERKQYQALKRAHTKSPRPVKEKMLSLVRKTLAASHV